MTLALGVLCSGEGTNLQAILDACASASLDASVRLVLCNKAGAPALDRAARAGVPHRLLRHGDYPDRDSYDGALVEALRGAGVTMVVLAGFLRIVGARFLDAFPDRVINVHPSLLPAFPGVDAHAQALAYCVSVSGCTVHLLDAGTDTGPILAQAVVPVLDGDTRASLADRIRPLEHRLLVDVLSWFAEGRVDLTREVTGARPRVTVRGRERALGVVAR